MKRKIIFRFLFILLALYLLIDGGIHVKNWIWSPKVAWVNPVLTPAQLQEDFRIFRNVLDSVHPGTYRYTDKKTLNAYFDSIAQTLDRPMSSLEFYKVLRPAAARIHCAHTMLEIGDSLWDSLRALHSYPPVRLCLIGGKVRLNGFPFNTGCIIDSINGEPAKKVLEKLRPLEMVDGFNAEAADAHIFDRFKFDYWLLYGDKLDFCFSTYNPDNGKRSSYCPGTELFEPHIIYPISYFTPSIYDFVIVDSLNTGILTIPTFTFGTQNEGKAFEHFLDHSFGLMRLGKINNLVIDLRYNLGGTNLQEAYLRSFFVGQTCSINETVLYKSERVACRKYLDQHYVDADQVDYFVKQNCTRNDSGWYALTNEEENKCKPSPTPYTGNVIIMVNGQTNSAAARFAAVMQSSGRARIWGATTSGGRYGSNSLQMIHYLLPNSRLQLGVPAAFADYGIPHNGPDSISGVIPDLPYTGPATLSGFSKEGELNDLLAFIRERKNN